MSKNLKNCEKLKFLPDQLYTKKMCKNADKKLPFVITNVPDRYRAKKIWDKVIIENRGILLRFIPDCYKNI